MPVNEELADGWTWIYYFTGLVASIIAATVFWLFHGTKRVCCGKTEAIRGYERSVNNGIDANDVGISVESVDVEHKKELQWRYKVNLTFKGLMVLFGVPGHTMLLGHRFVDDDEYEIPASFSRNKWILLIRICNIALILAVV